MLDSVKFSDNILYGFVVNELKRQRSKIELIASENYAPVEVLELQGSILTNKYAEGTPGKRYHAGCEAIDDIENLAIDRAKVLFGADHANVQAHSGVNANLAVFMTLLNVGDKVMGMSLDHGGHLSHGSKVNISGKYYNFKQYGLNRDTELIDYDAMEEMATAFKPRLIIAGASAYSRYIDYKRISNIAKSVDAYFMVDMAHVAGLVAANVHPSPVPYADFVTSTTTKTLRGARGGFILCRKEFANKLDKAIFPGIQGGPIPQIMAAKAYTFKYAMSNDFKDYAAQTVKNAKTIARVLSENGFRIVSGGTDNHLMLVDLRNKNLTGVQLEKALEYVGIMVNKNMIPYDPNPPVVTSGIRIGAAAMTSRGLKEGEMEEISYMINQVSDNIDNNSVLDKIKSHVSRLCDKYPLYEDLDRP